MHIGYVQYRFSQFEFYRGKVKVHVKLHLKSLKNRWITHHFHEFGIVEVVDDVFEDVSICDESESSENDHHRNLLLDVWKDSDDSLAWKVSD